MAYTDLPPIPMNRGTVIPGDPRFRHSRVTAFFAAAPKRVRRDSPPTEWVVCVRTGDVVDHHRFDTRLEAEHFALVVDPAFIIPEEKT